MECSEQQQQWDTICDGEGGRFLHSRWIEFTGCSVCRDGNDAGLIRF